MSSLPETKPGEAVMWSGSPYGGPHGVLVMSTPSAAGVRDRMAIVRMFAALLRWFGR